MDIKDFKNISPIACHDPKVGHELRAYRESNCQNNYCYDNKNGAIKGQVTTKTAMIHKLYQRYPRLPYRDTGHVKKDRGYQTDFDDRNLSKRCREYHASCEY